LPKHNSRRGDAKLADEAYRCLGMMVHDGMEFNNDLLNYRKLTKGNRRYNLKINGPEVNRMRSFLKATYEGFLNGEWTHYAIPRTGVRTRNQHDEDASVLPMDINDHKTMRLSSQKTGTEIVEAGTSELIDVAYVAAVDWHGNLKKKWDSLMKRKWKFKEHLNQDQLATELPQYMRVEECKNESKREQKRRKKRKRVDSIDVLYK